MNRFAWGFLEAVLIDLSIFAIIIIIFFKFKKYRGNLDPNIKYPVFLHESSLKLKELILKIYNTDLDEIKQVCGDESHHYLYLNKILAIFISGICTYSIIILLPVYDAGSRDSKDMHNIGFYNIIDEEKLLVAPMLIFLINIVASYYLLKLYVAESQNGNSYSTKNKNAARIINLPKEMTQEKLTENIYQCLGTEQIVVYVVPQLFQAMIYQRKLEKAQEELLHYLDFEKTYHKRDTFRKTICCGEKIDGIDYWEGKVQRNKKKLEREFEKSKTINSGVCIISIPGIIELRKIREKIRPVFSRAIVTSIVNPEDLNWENIAVDKHESKNSRIWLTVLFFFLFVIILTPVTFLDTVYSILEGLGFSQALIGFLSIYAPEIILLIYQLLIVPYSVEYLVKKEKIISKSEEVISGIRKFILFYMFNMLLVPALGMQTVEIIDEALDTSSFDGWSKSMVMRINDTSIWFMTLIVTQTFIINGKDLLQPIRLIEVRYRSFRAISEREKYKAFLPEKMKYSVNYALLISFFAVVMVYSVSYPLILLFGSMYLWIRVRII